jgi:hypothetical protein
MFVDEQRYIVLLMMEVTQQRVCVFHPINNILLLGNYLLFYFIKSLVFYFSQKSGIVNVYSYDDVMQNGEPKPIKYLKNLTTPIQSVKINASSELLAMNSYHLPKAVRLVGENN